MFDERVSVFQITIFFLYLIAATTLAYSRLASQPTVAQTLLTTALASAFAGALWHANKLWNLIVVPDGMSLSIGNAASFIGLQLAATAFIGAVVEANLRGLAAGLFVLAAVMAVFTGWQQPEVAAAIDWQIRAHVLISLFAYGLLSVGAIVAVFALVQERRLRLRQLSATNQLFTPLETTEGLLFGITSAGFLTLLLAVSTGFAFVDNLFSQHLVHKTALSILALFLFGVLLAGRLFAGWRGRQAVYLYLWGFLILCLAYFGTRYILEEVLGRSWS